MTFEVHAAHRGLIRGALVGIDVAKSLLQLSCLLQKQLRRTAPVDMTIK